MILAADIGLGSLLALVLSSSGGTAALAAWVNRRKSAAEVGKVRADTTASIVAASDQVVEMMTEAMARQQADIDDLRRRLNEMAAAATRDRQLLRIAVVHIRSQDAHMIAHMIAPLTLPAELEDQ